jgi:phenylacetate-CoA ligase
MFVTALAQLRFSASLVLGWRFSLWSLERLLDALRMTQAEFGSLDKDGIEMLQGPALDELDYREVHLRRFRIQAVRAAQDTRYYQRLFTELHLDPAKLTYADIARLPVTPKETVRENADDFVRHSATPTFRTTTTGTTGKPTSICFSAHEMQSYIALAAIGLLARREVATEDIVQISTSARATLGNTCAALAYERIGALWYQTGLIEPAQALALLAERHRLPGKKQQTSYLNTYPSYLGQLVEYGLAAGYGPTNFGLEGISVGGEVVTAGLKARAQQLFGPVRFSEGYAMTETWPTAGILCSQGHLHFEISQALVEVLDPHTGRTAEGGSAGTLVVTPLSPYRETTLLLRYDTQDVVQAVAGRLTCELHHLPVTSNLLGKLRLSVCHDEGWTYPRAVLEALETIDNVPLPARCGFWAVPHGVAVEVVVRSVSPGVRRQVEETLAAQGVPVQELHLVEDPYRLRHPLPLRCDLRELAFSPSCPRPDSLHLPQ